MPTPYDCLFTETEMSPKIEAACLCLAAMAVPVIVVGFGVYKISEFISSFWKKETWI